MDEISVELECESGAEEPLKNAVFERETSLDESERMRLFKEAKVKKDVDVTLVFKEGKDLWPKTWSGISVNTTQYGRSLSVTYTYQKGQREGAGQLSLSQDSYEKVKFVCAWPELRAGGEKKIYRGGVQKGREGLFAGTETKKLGLEISLGELWETSGRGRAECNLKVTTSKN